MSVAHSLHLKEGQIHKLMEGKPVQISLEQMGVGGKHIIFLEKPNATKIRKGYLKGKGVRIILGENEKIKSNDSLMPRFAKGSPEAKAWGEKMKSLRKKGKGIGSDIGRAVGGLAGTATGSPIAGMAGAHIGAKLGDMGEKGITKLLRGKGAQLSKPMKKAMKDNFSVVLPTKSLRASASGKVDGRVKPAGDMMTLSPYQNTNSPAMNPFVPITYFQEGGQGSGYGEGKVPSVIRGSGMRRGRGMYGGGLYGAGL